jgi:amidohydrolase
MLEAIRHLSHSNLNDTITLMEHLHQNPELSFQEFSTAKRIEQELDSIGIPFHSGIGGTGIIGIIEGDESGPTLGIRAELDALPIQEETGLKYASSTPNVMHACGHDVHMANLVTTARILWQLRHLVKGRILLIFQPGEELLPGGAIKIIESKEFEDNKPDMMLGLHILPELAAGMVGFRSGAYMASGDEIYLTIKGKGGHAALPHNLIDPVLITSHILVALQQVVSRFAPAYIPTVLSFGKVLANGANNIIPDEVKIEGTFRTMDEKWRSDAHSRIESIVKGIASSMGGSCDVDIRKGYPTLYNNPELNRIAHDASVDYIGYNNVVDLPLRMTTDDFARYAQSIPSVYFRIGSGYPKSEEYSLHSSKLRVNENVFEHSAGLLAWIALNIIDKYK